MKSPGATRLKKGAGKHHRIDIRFSYAGPQGDLDFFSDRFSLHISLDKGKVSGSTIVSGDHHSAKLEFNPKNQWYLEYTHEKNSETMSLSARFGKITKSTNLFGVSHKDRVHDIRLLFSEQLGLHGYVGARTKSLFFGLRFTKRGTASVEIKHRGKNHNLKVKFFPDGGYELKIKTKVAGGKITVSKARNSIKAEASFTF